MIMDSEKVVKEINSLIQLDIDAIHLYEEAIGKVDHMVIKSQLTRFRDDHQRHVTNLSEALRRIGGTPVEIKQDLMGKVLEGFTSLRSITGTEGALKAMRSNELLTNKSYEKALSFELPLDLLNIVRQNREDERRHLEYIENCLNQRTWESETKVA